MKITVDCDCTLCVAMNLLERATTMFEEQAPDPEWFRDYFELTGEWMVLTDEGWQPGENKGDIIKDYGIDAILDEINAPVVVVG